MNASTTYIFQHSPTHKHSKKNCIALLDHKGGTKSQTNAYMTAGKYKHTFLNTHRYTYTVKIMALPNRIIWVAHTNAYMTTCKFKRTFLITYIVKKKNSIGSPDHIDGTYANANITACSMILHF